MENRIAVPNGKRKIYITIMIISALFVAIGLLLIYLGNTHKFLGAATEITATVERVEYDEDESSEVFIYTKEQKLPFRITSVYTTGSDAMVSPEALCSELTAGTVITVMALDADMENKSGVYIRALRTSEKVYIDEEKAKEAIEQNDRVTMTIGMVFGGVAFAALVSGVLLLIFARGSVETDLFRFFGESICGPQPNGARKYLLPSILVIVCPLIFIVPLIVCSETGNDFLAAVFAIIMLVTFLIGIVIAAILGVKLNKMRRGFYKELFTFSPDKLTDAKEGLFPCQTYAGAELFRIDENGISSIADSAYDRIYYDIVSDKIKVGTAPKTLKNRLDELNNFVAFDEKGIPVAGMEPEEPVFEDYATPAAEKIGIMQSENKDASFENNDAPLDTLTVGDTPTIPFDKANLRAIAIYKKGITPMTVIVATDLEEGEFGLDKDLFFILDPELYSVLKSLNIEVKGLDDALSDIDERMAKSKCKPTLYGY